jgi:hypothetical protein
VRNPEMMLAAERIGSRICQGLLFGSLVISGALLIATEHLYVGVSLLGAAVAGTVFQRIILWRTNTHSKR